MNTGRELKWWNKPIRMIRYDPLNDFTNFLSGDLRQHADEVRNTCHANCEWIMANGGSSPGTAHIVNFDSPHFEKNPTLGGRDILREYLPPAQAVGIHLIAYVNLHWFSYNFAAQHPGWEQMQADGVSYGKAHPLYGNGTTMCVNSPWRDFAFLLLSEVMITGVEGVFLDGPVVFPGACYCETCLDQFKAQTGFDAPKEENWSNEWKAWVDFREDSMQRFVRDARRAVRETNDEGIIFCNAGGWQLSTQSARNPWKLETEQDITGAEVFVHYGVPHEDWLDTTVMAKFLSAGDNPAVVFSDHAVGGWHYVGMPAAELGREFYQTVAGGANPWIAVFTPALEHQKAKTLNPVTDGWSLVESIEGFLENDEPAAKIALVRSDATARHYLSHLESLRTGASTGKEEDLIASISRGTVQDTIAFKRTCEDHSAEEFRGWCYILTRQHLPFSVLRDSDLTSETLAQYDCIILPNAACLAEDALDELRVFQEAGGAVVSTFESGWYDETGSIRTPGEGGAGIGRPKQLEAFEPAAFEEYAIIESGAGNIPEFDTHELIPRPEHALKISGIKETEVLARYMNPVGFHYRPPQGVSPYPMALKGGLGKGKWLYFACAPGAEWMRFRIPHWERFAGAAIRSVIGSRCQIVTNAPPTMQIELRRQRARIVIHLINNTGDNEFPLGSVIPVSTFSLSVRSKEPKSAIFDGGTRIPFSYQDGMVTLSIDMIKQYRLVVLSGFVR
jgi:hypothetical protein